MEITRSNDMMRELMDTSPLDSIGEAEAQYVDREVYDVQTQSLEDVAGDDIFKDVEEDVDYCQDEDIRETLECGKRVAEKIVEGVAMVVPGGQGVAVEMAAKEVVENVVKECAKAVVKEIAKNTVSGIIDATESESLQKLKAPIVNAVEKKIEASTPEVKGNTFKDEDLGEAKGPMPRYGENLDYNYVQEKMDAKELASDVCEVKNQEVAEESESLQHVKGHVVDYATRTVDTNVVSEGNGMENEARTELPSHAKVELPPQASLEDMQKPIFEKNGCEDVKLAEKAEPIDTESRSETKDTLPPNATIEIDGKKCETDDNGEIYAVDGKLMPNVEYSLNGFKYRTDEHGRIVHAEGEVKLTDKGRDPMPEISSKDKKDTDDKGHVIGHQIGGLEKIGNLVPQDFNLNRGEYKKLENELARLAKEGHNIKVEVSLKYKEGSDRPDTFRVKYTVDGKTYVKIFKNESSKNGGNQ